VPTPKPYLAFLAAFLVLLVVPLLVMFGLMALGLAAGTGMMSEMSRMMDGETGDVTLGVFVVWVVLVLSAALAVIALLIRRAART
jgi:glucan phosphoethanolaminetransferase (alkaline phosphatase superfamily)